LSVVFLPVWHPVRGRDDQTFIGGDRRIGHSPVRRSGPAGGDLSEDRPEDALFVVSDSDVKDAVLYVGFQIE
jgi:hypothetical protein